MKIRVIQVPYDSGHRSLRMGSGPEHLVDNGLAVVLEADGHEVSIETIEAQTEFRAEVQTQFELYRLLAEQVANARQNGAFPLVLSGNCGATLGVIAGSNLERLGIIWFDAHGEFNTPETTTSGFLDGMGLAIATGLCWNKLASSIRNFRPIRGGSILLVGGRDFDAGEQERAEQAGVTILEAAAIQPAGMQSALYPHVERFLQATEEIHLHLDLDVLNPRETPANSFLTDDGGLSVEQLSEAIALIKQNQNVTSATIASYDPRHDPHEKTLQASFNLIRQIVGNH